MKTLIKILLAILFFVCLLKMPYGYYQIVRFVGLVGFIILSYMAYQNGQKNLCILYSCLAILFQPFFKIALGREIWNVVDVIVASALIISVILSKGKKQQKQ